MDIMETIQTILAICGGISVIGGAAAVLSGAYKKYKKPTSDLEQRIEVIESDIKDIKQKLNNDYENINNNRNDMNLLMRSMFCLIENKITGNNIEGLKKNKRRAYKRIDRKIRGDGLKVYDFTVPELNYFRTYCNFTKDEEILFELRAKNMPLEQCAEIMNVSVSTIKRLSRKVNNKIIRVC